MQFRGKVSEEEKDSLNNNFSLTRSDKTKKDHGLIWKALLVIILFNQMTAFFGFSKFLGGAAVPSSSYVPASLSHRHSILDIPEGEAIALPSIRITKEEEHSENIVRTVYGGEGDKKHLGGFTDIDLQGVSPSTWKYMVEWFGVKSLLDVGCGRGISTSWFDLHGVEVQCVEGSHDAIEKNIVPDKEHKIVEHDFSRGPWWPSKTVDAVWCVEFIEHVGRNFHQNYIPAFRKAALIFVSHSHWGGWHHVEVHKNPWWIEKFESYGFRYSDHLTNLVRATALEEKAKAIPSPNGEPYNAQHVWLTIQVFINPAVASLPEHTHLFAEPGCFSGSGSKECGKDPNGHLETPLPDEYKPLNLTSEMDDAWVELIKNNVQIKNKL
mmetsp:Transcript_1057/g.1627  ORF Transcript_1057/g.1627 Transcript_1057/m.1627 type:complete len:380 (-) Transcript_1057:233-1372(-)